MRSNRPACGGGWTVWKYPFVDALAGWKIPSLPRRLPFTESVEGRGVKRLAMDYLRLRRGLGDTAELLHRAGRWKSRRLSQCLSFTWNSPVRVDWPASPQAV